MAHQAQDRGDRVNQPTAESYALSVPEGCTFSGIGETTFRELIRVGEIPHIRVGRRVLVPRQGLQEWLDARTVCSQSAEAA